MKGNLYVITGPSGVGKDTLVALIFNEIPSLKSSVSITTRLPRPGEVDGVEYFFVSKSKALDLINNNKLLEWNEYAGNIYGTPADFINEHLKAGDDIVLSIDFHGALNVKKNFKEAKLIFISPPSIDELKKRLISRGTEPVDVIAKRLDIAKTELKKQSLFDYIVVNDNLQEASKQLCDYIKSEM